MACGSSDASKAMVQQQRQQDALTQQSVGNINSAFSRFNPQFYSGIGQAYQDYALPQFSRDYQQAQNQLGFRLTNQGLGNSSQSDFLTGKLGQARTDATQQIASQAMTQEQQLQQQVAQEKARLMAQAQSASNPSGIGQQALSSAASFQAPSSFLPIGNLLSQFGQLYLAGQNANTYNTASQNMGYNSLGYSSGGSSFLPRTTY